MTSWLLEGYGNSITKNSTSFPVHCLPHLSAQTVQTYGFVVVVVIILLASPVVRADG